MVRATGFATFIFHVLLLQQHYRSLSCMALKQPVLPTLSMMHHSQEKVRTSRDKHLAAPPLHSSLSKAQLNNKLLQPEHPLSSSCSKNHEDSQGAAASCGEAAAKPVDLQAEPWAEPWLTLTAKSISHPWLCLVA